MARIVLPEGAYYVTASGNATAAVKSGIANAQMQMGFYANSTNTYLEQTASTTQRDKISSANKTTFELPILNADTDISAPMYHSTIVNISTYPVLNLYARRTSASIDGASANTISGYFLKGRLTATPLYLKAV